MMQRVFLLEDVRDGVDISDAKRYGDLVRLFEPGERKPSLFSDEFDEVVWQKLVKYCFNPRQDFFLIAGSTIGLFRAATVLASEFSVFHILAFNAVNQQYVKLTLKDSE